MQTTLKKRKPGKSPLETGVNGGTQEMKGNEDVDENQSLSVLTLSEWRGTTTSIRGKAGTSWCSNYDVNFRNLDEEHKYGVGRGSAWNGGLCFGRPTVQHMKGSKQWS